MIFLESWNLLQSYSCIQSQRIELSFQMTNPLFSLSVQICMFVYLLVFCFFVKIKKANLLNFVCLLSGRKSVQF